MDNEISKAGAWSKLKVLGCGGFGQVTLWCNSHNGLKIALKNLHEFVPNDEAGRVKQVERWCNEVDIMKKLSHKNIIATLEIPPELGSLTSMPILAMEYCSQGDLRQVLYKPENCCGLPENQVLEIMKDVSNGLAYLHSCKIVHRDIKPENIVLQEKDSVIVYKLIDLGYAKSLDQSSLLKSFVGTIQYIAPELFLGKEYTSSVDYWSFGLLTHEIITGHRPFLPGFNAADWMKKIQGKPRQIISVLDNGDGEITYNSKITTKNNMSGCLIEEMEKWLQLALDWDGQTRGRDLNTKRLLIFENLTCILSKKVIHVFVMVSADTLSYEVTKDTNICDVRAWLQKDTDIHIENQLLLSPNGTSLPPDGNLFTFFNEQKPEKKSRVNFYLFRKDLLKIDYRGSGFESISNEINSYSKKVVRYRNWKRSFAHLVHILQTQAFKCSCVLQGIRTKIDNTKENTLEIEALGEDIREEWKEVENFNRFLSFSHKIDLENYIYYRKTKKLKSSLLVQKWIQHVIEINNKMSELKSSYNVGEHKQLVLSAKQRCRSLEFSQPPTTPLDDIVSKAYLLWEKILNTSNNEVATPADISSAENLRTLCAQESQVFFTDQTLLSLISKIKEIDENLAQLKLHLKTVLKSITIVKSLIENTQKERQKEVWALVGSSSFSDGNKIEEKKKDSEKLKNDLVNGKTLDVETLIKDNSFLRQRIHDVQQDCDKMIKNISLLNLDAADIL